MPLLDRVRIHGYRAAREVTLEPGALCALVGEAASGKSTVLNAVWTLLEAAAPVPTGDDVSRGGWKRIRIEADSGERTIFLDSRPPETLNLNRDGAPPVLFLPASLRAGPVVAPATSAEGARAAGLLRPPETNGAWPWAAGDGGLAVVAGLEVLCDAGIDGLVVLIEEPELYLAPPAQRHLYRLLRRLSANGNQILYSTHAPVFLNVARLGELALVRHDEREGTALSQPDPLNEAEAFRALAEFDADRTELFLSRAALLVEGRTEKLVFPLVFEALGFDPDREAVTILECGGKSNMPLFARICNACGIPYVVVHDRDAPLGEEPLESERIVNANIEEAAGPERTVLLVPDFEGVAGVRSRTRKPARAWARFRERNPDGVPEPLAEAVHRVVAAARS